VLKVDRNLTTSDGKATVTNLWFFNPCDFLKIDCYLKNLPEKKIIDDFFKDWGLIGESIDLNPIFFRILCRRTMKFFCWLSALIGMVLSVDFSVITADVGVGLRRSG